MQVVRGYWGIFRGIVEEEYSIIYPGGTAVELTSRPTIRVVSHF